MADNFFSPAEVAVHNTEKDCWIIIRNKVYDVSSYLDDHPGGVEIVTDLAGQDSTEDYDDVGHSVRFLFIFCVVCLLPPSLPLFCGFFCWLTF